MSKNRPVQPSLTRKQVSRAQRERELQRVVMIGAAVVGVLLAALLGWAALDTLVLQPGQAVARVGEVSITSGEFQKAVKFRRYQLINQYIQLSDPQLAQFFGQQLQQIEAELSDPNTLGRTVLDEMVNNLLIRQEAARRGITVDAAELDGRVQEYFGYTPNGTATPTITPSPLPTDAVPTVNPTVVAAWTPTPTITPTATLTPTATATPGPSATPPATSTPAPTPTPLTTQAYATRVAEYGGEVGRQTGLSDADIRYYVESFVYREKLEAVIGAERVTSTQTQVHARHILVNDEATIRDIQQRLAAGELWDALAAQFSQDPSNASNGGELGWFGTGRMVAEFEAVAFATAPGTISEPVQTQFGWHLIQVLEKADRVVDSATLAQLRRTAFEDWLTEQREVKDAAGKLLTEVFDLWITQVPDTPTVASVAGQ